jgi:hypothetical protein
MDDIIKAKHVLGALTLGDLKDQIKGLEVYIDDVFYAVQRIEDDFLMLWETSERYYHDEGADRLIDLSTPIKLRDGHIIILDEFSNIEETMVFGKNEFTEKKIEIPLS